MAGYSVDEIDDIRIAVSEVLLALIEHGAGRLIEVEFAVDGERSSCGPTPRSSRSTPNIPISPFVAQCSPASARRTGSS